MAIDPALLAAHPLFASIPARDLARLGEIMEPTTVEEGATLIKQGDGPGPLYLILEGAIEVHHRSRPGAPLLLARLGPGRLVGYLAHLDGPCRSATVTASEKSLLGALSPEDTRTLLEDRSSWAARFQMALAQDMVRTLRSADQCFVAAATMPVRELLKFRHVKR